MVMHPCNPITPEAEAGGPGVYNQPNLDSERLPQNDNREEKERNTEVGEETSIRCIL